VRQQFFSWAKVNPTAAGERAHPKIHLNFSDCIARSNALTFYYYLSTPNVSWRGNNMDEKSLIKQWTQLRAQIIQAQVAPALVLIAIVALAAIGEFNDASDGAKYFALGVTAVTGILATISQYAAVREGEALIIDLRKVEKPSALTEKIADSRGLVSLSAIAIITFDIAIFALAVWAVLGA
jgi:hypothetical protein